MAVQIVLNQSGAPAGVAGQAREDLVTGVPVVAQAIGGPFSTYRWSFIDRPPDIIAGTPSNAAFSAPTSPSTNVTPVDKPGTYLIEVAVDSGQGLGATEDDVARITFYAALVGDPLQGVLSADPTKLPWRMPAFGERREHNVPDAIFPTGNQRGWAQSWLHIFAYLRALAGGGGGGLTPVAVTATGASAVGTCEVVGTRAVAITRSLPVAAAGAVIEVVDDAAIASGFAITVQTTGGDTLLNATFANTAVLNTDGETALFRKVSSARWARIY